MFEFNEYSGIENAVFHFHACVSSREDFMSESVVKRPST